MRKSFLTNCKIISNHKLSDKYFKLVFESETIAKNAFPGQFVELGVSDLGVPLLRRPLSIHRIGNRETGKGERVKHDFVEIL